MCSSSGQGRRAMSGNVPTFTTARWNGAWSAM
jgi:hypothetical protein